MFSQLRDARSGVRWLIFLFVYCFVVFQDRVSLFIPSCPGICRLLLASNSEIRLPLSPRGLELKVFTTTPSKTFYFVKQLGSSETEAWGSEGNISI